MRPAVARSTRNYRIEAMTIFDLMPLAGRKTSTVIAIGFLLTYAISPAATTRFVQSQFKQLTVEITHDLLRGIPPSLSSPPNVHG
jgi:hypothetical protein